ncbi:hypothetical protein ACSBR1_031938 [Camellia fascicularis]
MSNFSFLDFLGKICLLFSDYGIEHKSTSSEHHCVANFLCFTSLVGVVSLVGE